MMVTPTGIIVLMVREVLGKKMSLDGVGGVGTRGTRLLQGEQRTNLRTQTVGYNIQNVSEG